MKLFAAPTRVNLFKNFELRAAWEAEFVRFQFLEVDQKQMGYLGL